MRKFKVEFKQDGENTVNCFSKDSNDTKYTTDAVLSPDEEFLVIKTIRAICQTSVLLGIANDAYKLKKYKTFNEAFNFLNVGIVKDIQPTIESVQDNLSRYRAVRYIDVEIDEKTLVASISTVPTPLSIMMYGGEIRQLEWSSNLTAIKAAYKNCA